MKTYKHYSFDLWLTLIKSNPLFKKERADFFHKKLNPKKKTLGEVEMIFRNVDVMCNQINHKTGGNIDSEEMYLMVISMLADYSTSFDNIDIHWVEEKMEKLFFDYMPTLLSVETKNTLDLIHQKGACSMNILSNTAFIKGAMLRPLLQHLGLSSYFDFQLYSDEVGLSKPNTRFFQLMLDQAMSNDKMIGLDDIVHVGDNLTADIAGAKAIGINSFHIHTNNPILSLVN
jgi:putative hydrolase of the HAD superfamily